MTIKTKPASAEYRANYDEIFKKNTNSTIGVFKSIVFPLEEVMTMTFYETRGKPVMSLYPDGRLIWREREVTTDDELRSMIRDLHATLCGRKS